MVIELVPATSFPLPPVEKSIVYGEVSGPGVGVVTVTDAEVTVVVVCAILYEGDV